MSKLWQKSRENHDIHNVNSDTQLNLLPMVDPKDPHGIPIDTQGWGEIRRNGTEIIQNDPDADEHDNVSAGVMRTYNPKPQYVPPLNFALVEDGIYRSGFPMPINYTFLRQLGLKTIIYIGDLGHETKRKDKKEKKEKDKEKDKKDKDKKDKQSTAEIMANYQEWIHNNTDITFHNLLIQSSQEPFNSAEISQQAQESYSKTLQLMLDKRNFPILVHSNKGKHRVGLLVGLMRKLLQGWCLSGIFEEYEKFAMGKSVFDLEIIELWQPELWVQDEYKPDFVRI